LLAALAEQARAKATKAISIRVPVADLERARQIASKEGTGYQTVLKRAIHAGLRKVS
jgi:predicted DNA binding CopG/RHH family protein